MIHITRAPSSLASWPAPLVGPAHVRVGGSSSFLPAAAGPCAKMLQPVTGSAGVRGWGAARSDSHTPLPFATSHTHASLSWGPWGELHATGECIATTSEDSTGCGPQGLIYSFPQRCFPGQHRYRRPYLNVALGGTLEGHLASA